MDEQYRPQWQFSPQHNWTNDPNGLVYYNGQYHLFYQHHPDSCVWGPMHWGHAVTTDLLHWQHLPIALYPDALGTIFSGSAVSDTACTSPFCQDGCVPLVCIYTQHGYDGVQQQSIAYSTDGIRFTPYPGNPVIPNPGCKDFRDPKVFWYEAEQRWGLVLAAGNHVEFYASSDLVHWRYTGRFGPEGNHAPGVWECPDIFPMTTPEGEKWVLLVSMGMDRVNGGSRTQYFVGNFDGMCFHAGDAQPGTLWLDYGPDSYAGVTFFGEPHGKRILISWMTNWLYADKAPTQDYRGQMSFPIELQLVQTPQGYRLSGKPILAINTLQQSSIVLASGDLPSGPISIKLTGDSPFSIRLENNWGEYVDIGATDASSIYVDRTFAGGGEIDPIFGKKHTAPRLIAGPISMHILLDHCALTVFADQGTCLLSTTLFPKEPYFHILVTGVVEGTCTQLSSQ